MQRPWNLHLPTKSFVTYMLPQYKLAKPVRPLAASQQPVVDIGSIDEVLVAMKDAFNDVPAINDHVQSASVASSSNNSDTMRNSAYRKKSSSNTSTSGAAAMPAAGTNRHRTLSSNSTKGNQSQHIGGALKQRSSRLSKPESFNSIAAPPPVLKKRKGPFSDLIASLQQDMQHTAQGTKPGQSSNQPQHEHGVHVCSAFFWPLSSQQAAQAPASSNSSRSSSSSAQQQAGSEPQRRRSLNRRARLQLSAEAGCHPCGMEPAAQQQLLQQQQQQWQRPQQQQQDAPQRQPSTNNQQQQREDPPWMQQLAAEAAGSRKKQYKPVLKGDLLLPGGPAWSALRRHIFPVGTKPDLPTMNSIVVVEGDQDQQAVARAVNATVYVCDGTRVLKDHVRPELDMLKQLGRPIIVLTDPDERGRELRLHLDDMSGPLLHAFVPEPDAAATVDGSVHAAGNRGIEHLVPVGVQQALAGARSSYSRDRQVWSVERLQKLQLANAFDGAGGIASGAAARRRQLCALLGLGRCTTAQLVTVLNRFFAEPDVESALVKVPAVTEAEP